MSAELEEALERLNTQPSWQPQGSVDALQPGARAAPPRPPRPGHLQLPEPIRGKPDLAEAHFYLGECFLAHEKVEPAAAAFSRRRRRQRDYREALLAEADTLLALGRPARPPPRSGAPRSSIPPTCRCC